MGCCEPSVQCRLQGKSAYRRHLISDFWTFYARSATNCSQAGRRAIWQNSLALFCQMALIFVF
jgi:hypothetical protein